MDKVSRIVQIYHRCQNKASGLNVCAAIQKAS